MLQSKNYYKAVTFYNVLGKDSHKYMYVFCSLVHKKTFMILILILSLFWVCVALHLLVREIIDSWYWSKCGSNGCDSLFGFSHHLNQMYLKAPPLRCPHCYWDTLSAVCINFTQSEICLSQRTLIKLKRSIRRLEQKFDQWGGLSLWGKIYTRLWQRRSVCEIGL